MDLSIRFRAVDPRAPEATVATSVPVSMTGIGDCGLSGGDEPPCGSPDGTGAGKTNVAMLAILAELGKHMAAPPPLWFTITRSHVQNPPRLRPSQHEFGVGLGEAFAIPCVTMRPISS